MNRSAIILIVFIILASMLGQTTTEHFDNAKSVNENPYIPLDKTFVVMGHQIPLEPQSPAPMWGKEDMPHVGGGNKDMFVFAQNKVSPECCEHSAYSTDRGCVCIPDEQRKILQGEQ